MISVVLLYALCASTFTISKAILSYSAPLFSTAIRMLGAGALLFIIAWWRGEKSNFKRADFWLILQLAFFGIFLAFSGDHWSLQYMTSSESALVYNLTPFASALFSYFYFGERMTFLKWVAFALGLCGVFLLINQGDCCFAALNSLRILAFIVLIGVVFSSSYGWIVTRELVKVREYPVLWLNGVTMFTGGLLILLLSLIFEKGVYVPLVGNWPAFIWLTLAIIIVANGLFTNLYGVLLKKYTATLLSFAGFLCPFFASLYGALFLQEPLTLTFLFSSLAFGGGLVIFYLEEFRQGYINQN